MTPEGCPSDDELVAFVHGFASTAMTAALHGHIADCELCRPLVAQAASDLASAGSTGSCSEDDGGAAPALLEPGTRLGRYAIVSLIGYGAVGAVYAAHDAQLGRRVALKLLRPDRVTTEHAPRLLREGQALSRVSHPNVVAVHDAGTIDGVGFLAMELIDGQTLAAWLRTPRSIEHILEVFQEAGRGLAAAHRAGIVHRDFKLENVLIDREGRVRVTDFGLAREDAPGAVSTLKTEPGTILGTPAYMAPEQFRGEIAGIPADIFAFSSALYQALFKRHPFGGKLGLTLRDAVLGGEARLPARAWSVPGDVRRAVLRGLRRDPAQRFSSVDALLEAIAGAPRRPARVALFLLPVLAAAIVLVTAGAMDGPTTTPARDRREPPAAIAAPPAIERRMARPPVTASRLLRSVWSSRLATAR